MSEGEGRGGIRTVAQRSSMAMIFFLKLCLHTWVFIVLEVWTAYIYFAYIIL
jgi:hypothetical protein